MTELNIKDNMELWNKVCETDPAFTKRQPFGAKLTSIDAQYQMKIATQIWGPYGSNWGLFDLSYNYLDNGTCHMLATFKYPGGEFPISNTIIFQKGDVIDKDWAKKLETDTRTKALSLLGFNADVFMGMFDNDKYIQEMKEKYQEKIIDELTGEELDPEKIHKAVECFKEAVDKDVTEEERIQRIKQLRERLTQGEFMQVQARLNEKAPNTKRKYKNIIADYLKDPIVS